MIWLLLAPPGLLWLWCFTISPMGRHATGIEAAPPRPTMTEIETIKFRTPNAKRRAIAELYSRFGGSCRLCRAQLGIDDSPLYPPPVVVFIHGEQHPRQLCCESCVTPTPCSRKSKAPSKGCTPSTLKLLHTEQGGKCAYCGEQTILPKRKQRSDTATIDHVLPRSRGGQDCRSNYVLACFSCNGLKDDMTPRELLRSLIILGVIRAIEPTPPTPKPRKKRRPVARGLPSSFAPCLPAPALPLPGHQVAWLDDDIERPPQAVRIDTASTVA